MFYTFRQNNVGGNLIGPADFVIIEANDVSEYVSSDMVANCIAEQIGLDFEDYCPCCGHRWTKTNQYEGTEKPEVHGHEVYPEAFHYQYKRGYHSTYTEILVGSNPKKRAVLIIYLPE